MEDFLDNQKLKREEIVSLANRGRLKIINIQPESRLEYGFINEIFQTNPSSVISRRALSTLCAIDLVQMNQNYLFSDPDFEKLLFPLIKEMALLTNRDVSEVGNFLLWPRSALRKSVDILNQSGPMSISLYGVNELIAENLHHTDLSTENIEALEFEFNVHSSKVHLAHALDATYFPFFIDGEKYSDHPYTSMMGNLLNFYSTTNLHKVKKDNVYRPLNYANPSLDLISIFDVNDYISILQFEEEISSSVIRHGMRSLFSELSSLDGDQRNQRITKYNSEVEKSLKRKGISKFSLNLAVNFIPSPIIPLIIQIVPPLFKRAGNKYPGIRALQEIIKDKCDSILTGKKNDSILSQINRVARLKER